MLRSGCHVLILLVHMLRSRSQHVEALSILASEKFSGQTPREIRPQPLLKEGKMLNYHVFCQKRKRTLVPWMIEALEAPNVTFPVSFESFFPKKLTLMVYSLARPLLESPRTTLTL